MDTSTVRAGPVTSTCPCRLSPLPSPSQWALGKRPDLGTPDVVGRGRDFGVSRRIRKRGRIRLKRPEIYRVPTCQILHHEIVEGKRFVRRESKLELEKKGTSSSNPPPEEMVPVSQYLGGDFRRQTEKKVPRRRLGAKRRGHTRVTTYTCACVAVVTHIAHLHVYPVSGCVRGRVYVSVKWEPQYAWYPRRFYSYCVVHHRDGNHISLCSGRCYGGPCVSVSA